MGNEQCPPKEPIRRPCPPKKPVCPPKKPICPPRRPVCPPKPKCGCPDKFLFFPDCKRAKLNPTPPAGPAVCRDWNPFITADFIYWTARQEGLVHAGTISESGEHIKIKELDWKWDPGFKVGLGFNLPHDGWDIYAEYIWLRTSATRSVGSSQSIVIDTEPLLGSSSARWRLRFNDIHLEMGRNSYLSQFLKMRLHVGLQGAWVDQKYRVNQVILADSSNYRLRMKHNFWGVGLRSGIDSAFQFDSNWSLYGNLALSLLWGCFDLDRRTQISLNNVITSNLKIDGDVYSIEPIVDLQIGFRYQDWFEEGNYHLLIQAGWENQVWVLHNHYLKIDHAGDLFMQGLVVRVRFDF